MPRTRLPRSGASVRALSLVALAACHPAATMGAQRPSPRPWLSTLPPTTTVVASTAFGGGLGAGGGAVAGWLVALLRCDREALGLLGCARPSSAPMIGAFSGVLPGAVLGAIDGAQLVGCPARATSRRAIRGGLRGTAWGYVPLAAYAALGGRSSRTATRLALAGPTLQVGFTAAATLRCREDR